MKCGYGEAVPTEAAVGEKKFLSRGNPKKNTAGYAWVVTLVVWLTGICMPLNMLKVSILSPALMEAFAIGTDAISWVMALFYLVGVVLAIPGALVVNKIGYRMTFVVSLVCALVGGALGYFAQDVTLFMVSRVIEGIGFGLVGTAAIPAISAWFPASKRGVPLGVWAINVTAAFLIGPRLFSGLYASTGDYHTVWLLCLILNAVVLVVLVVLYRDPPFTFDKHERRVFTMKNSDEKPLKTAQPLLLLKVLRNPSVWIIGLIFFCEEVPFLGMSNFLTTYAVQETELSLTTMSSIISVMAIVGCIVNPLSGKLSDMIRSNKKLMVISCIGGSFYAWLVFQTTTVEGFIPVICLNALAGGIIPTMIWASVPKVVQAPEEIPAASAVVLFFQQLAAFSGSRILGIIVGQSGSFALAGQYFMAPLFALGLVVLLVAWKKVP